MPLTYEEARRQAEASIDAFNRRDADAFVDLLHEAVTHRGPFGAHHLGHEQGRVEGMFAIQLDAGGLIREFHVYHGPPSAP